MVRYGTLSRIINDNIDKFIGGKLKHGNDKITIICASEW